METHFSYNQPRQLTLKYNMEKQTFHRDQACSITYPRCVPRSHRILITGSPGSKYSSGTYLAMQQQTNLILWCYAHVKRTGVVQALERRECEADLTGYDEQHHVPPLLVSFVSPCSTTVFPLHNDRGSLLFRSCD
jgi:hypothetical protein